MSNSAKMIHRVQELARDLALVTNLASLYRQTVEGMVGALGFDKASLSLYNQETREVRGTWATDDWGLVYDDSDRLTFLGEWEWSVEKALGAADKLELKWTDQDWEALIVLQDGERILGWMVVDNGLRHRQLTDLEKEVLALCGRTFSTLFQRRQFADLLERFREQNALKDRLLTILGHDLRGPIGNLSNLLGIACDQTLEPDQLRPLLVEGRLASLRAYNLLENLLSWVRSQIEEVVNLRNRLPLIRPLISVQAWLDAQAKNKGVRLLVNCSETLTVVGDERMIETIVRNLVSNAVKFSPPNRPVTLQGRTVEGAIIIEVIDQGSGIAPAKVATLLSNQQKVSHVGTAGESGSGLGLMFSADLAKALGGHLEVESEVGQGSTFRLVLPDQIDGEL
jgi:signal transduction histidine kinase